MKKGIWKTGVFRAAATAGLMAAVAPHTCSVRTDIAVSATVANGYRVEVRSDGSVALGAKEAWARYGRVFRQRRSNALPKLSRSIGRIVMDF